MRENSLKQVKEKIQKENLTLHNHLEMMVRKNIFNNPEFDDRFNRVIESIENYIKDSNYDLGELEIDNIIGWHDIGQQRIIYASDKCPLDMKATITNLIKKEFPNPNEQ